jgi:hypothetical protein
VFQPAERRRLVFQVAVEEVDGRPHHVTEGGAGRVDGGIVVATEDGEESLGRPGPVEDVDTGHVGDGRVGVPVDQEQRGRVTVLDLAAGKGDRVS